MKVWRVIIKIVVALAAIAGAVYVAATYGDRITAWAKKLLRSIPCCGCDCDCDCECECECDECDCECECNCGCTCEEEAPAEEADEAVAEQADFEG